MDRRLNVNKFYIEIVRSNLSFIRHVWLQYERFVRMSFPQLSAFFNFTLSITRVTLRALYGQTYKMFVKFTSIHIIKLFHIYFSLFTDFHLYNEEKHATVNECAFFIIDNHVQSFILSRLKTESLFSNCLMKVQICVHFQFEIFHWEIFKSLIKPLMIMNPLCMNHETKYGIWYLIFSILRQ